MPDIREIKEKFNELQNNVTKLNNQKIGLESEIKTIESDMNDLGEKLLSATGKNTIEEAFEYFKEQNTLLEEKKERLSEDLDNYINMETSDSELSLD